MFVFESPITTCVMAARCFTLLCLCMVFAVRVLVLSRVPSSADPLVLSLFKTTVMSLVGMRVWILLRFLFVMDDAIMMLFRLFMSSRMCRILVLRVLVARPWLVPASIMSGCML